MNEGSVFVFYFCGIVMFNVFKKLYFCIMCGLCVNGIIVNY